MSVYCIFDIWPSKTLYTVGITYNESMAKCGVRCFTSCDGLFQVCDRSISQQSVTTVDRDIRSQMIIPDLWGVWHKTGKKGAKMW